MQFLLLLPFLCLNVHCMCVTEAAPTEQPHNFFFDVTTSVWRWTLPHQLSLKVFVYIHRLCWWYHITVWPCFCLNTTESPLRFRLFAPCVSCFTVQSLVLIHWPVDLPSAVDGVRRCSVIICSTICSLALIYCPVNYPFAHSLSV